VLADNPVMRRHVPTYAFWLASAAVLMTVTAAERPLAQAPSPTQAPLAGVDLVRSTYTKYEYMIPMRDAVEPAAITYALPDVYHAFRKGHRVMVQVQSSWFPLVDRNPQVFMEIPKAVPSDFKKATQRVYRSGAMASSITVMVQR
jgi:predicted acyl esterase